MGDAVWHVPHPLPVTRRLDRRVQQEEKTVPASEAALPSAGFAALRRRMTQKEEKHRRLNSPIKSANDEKGGANGVEGEHLAGFAASVRK